ncbi:MAG: DUF4268 domain-containing protein [Chloroflexota bacterium]|nr:DUF4268 domain-containing protein [Chloroflexota bacterium]
MGTVGKIQIVPVREAFRHEAHHFTGWLSENIEALAERIGLRLTVIAREQQVGDFKLDLLCQDGDGNYVIIENQLEQTNHDHLGKLLTYLVNIEDAKTAIWITPEPRAEHERVIDWLNQKTEIGLEFYLIKVEVIRISDSPYAPLFTIIKQPDRQTKAVGESNKDLANENEAERYQLRLEFWTHFVDRSRSRTKLFLTRRPRKNYYFGVKAGRGCHYYCYIQQNRAEIDLYIDTGNRDFNKAVFDDLYQQREAIEADFGEALEWRRLDDQRASRIVKVFHFGGLRQPEMWNELQDAMIDGTIRLERAFRPRLVGLKLK